MEDIPQIKKTVHYPIDITIHPYLLDHHFEDRVVFPAVETMAVLARAVRHYQPDAAITGMTRARFDKFLYVAPETTQVDAFCDITIQENGDISAALLTKNRSPKSSITRIKEHGTLCFPQQTPDLSPPPMDLTSALEGICFEIPAEKIYRDLVPFGKAYQNICDHLIISEDGAIAKTRASSVNIEAANLDQVGSPFPFDAALHGACVWGQRYAQIVAFPVGIERRIIYKPTRSGITYLSRILPVRMEADRLIFDIWIYDNDGNLYEGACGVHMRDVSSGRMKPPRWIIDHREQKPPEHVPRRCRAFSVIELQTLMPFAEKALSDNERERFQNMEHKRKRSYLAARLALKRLSRILSGNDMQTAASEITTVRADGVRPCCLRTDGSAPLFCSASHDDRFAVAVACDRGVGVDVEKMSKRVLKAQGLYMSEQEQALVRDCHLGEIEAALRIWSLKEAAAKALGINLADSWNRVRVKAIGACESSYQIDDQDSGTAVHDVVGKHVITLFDCL
ncbi:4'-phosphopantetheinyl transferase superfamily protein [Thermodesulfobacteriota bacterium]